MVVRGVDRREIPALSEPLRDLTEDLGTVVVERGASTRVEVRGTTRLVDPVRGAVTRGVKVRGVVARGVTVRGVTERGVTDRGVERTRGVVARGMVRGVLRIDGVDR